MFVGLIYETKAKETNSNLPEVPCHEESADKCHKLSVRIETKGTPASNFVERSDLI